MKSFLFFASMLSLLIEATLPANPMESMEKRVKNLKREILDEMKDDIGTHDIEVYKDIYEYIENSYKTTTPASTRRPNLDVLRELEPKRTTPEKFMGSPEKMDTISPLKIKNHKSKKAKRQSSKKKKKQNTEIFYRRAYFDTNVRDKPQKWTHCLDLLSPYLNGFLSNVSESKSIRATHLNVRRLVYLLGLNMTEATNEDIRAVLYEISRLQLRLFQWEVDAMRAVMNVIIQDYRHDFKGLKYGIKTLFANWKLNTSNLTRVLSQSRIFRPPCLKVTEYGGSTVTPRSDRSMFTKKPSKPKCNNRRQNGGNEECLDYYD
ncbi:hypothetical protein PYW08_012215 [Mythimna loreyi]|uniref:Uncharacterized protein n=1 Tax=Mythimna loreyi TaxID=667449 RepID=A0ACC2Q1Z6_9NEOP|nr:hypothetical protein PYW08_012215 [Mythimna loreyi]